MDNFDSKQAKLSNVVGRQCKHRAWSLLGMWMPVSSLAQGHAGSLIVGHSGASGGDTMGSQPALSCGNTSRFVVSPLPRLPMCLVTLAGALSLVLPGSSNVDGRMGHSRGCSREMSIFFHLPLSHCPNAWLPSHHPPPAFPDLTFPDLTFPCVWAWGGRAQQLGWMVLLGGPWNHHCMLIEVHCFLQQSW